MAGKKNVNMNIRAQQKLQKLMQVVYPRNMKKYTNIYTL